ncbi:UDP-sugar hydrolase [Klebsiella aerogenes]|nr:UDP-sugar hydrolase [Klebsiella aerogenes]
MTYDNGQSERVLYTPQIAENPQMMSLLTPFQNKGKAQLQVKIGSVNGHLEGDRSKVRLCRPIWGTCCWRRRWRAAMRISR